MAHRQPVAVVVTPDQKFHTVYCDDGSVFRHAVDTGAWEELSIPLPGSAAADRRAGEIRQRT